MNLKISREFPWNEPPGLSHESDILRGKLREGRIFSALAIDLFHNNFSFSGSPPELRKLAHEF